MDKQPLSDFGVCHYTFSYFYTTKRIHEKKKREGLPPGLKQRKRLDLVELAPFLYRSKVG